MFLPRFTIRLAAVALILGMASGSAWGQFFYQPLTISSPISPYTPYMGGYSWGNPYQQGFGGYPIYTTMPSYGYPYYYGDASYSATFTVPGWSVSSDSIPGSVTRSRSTMSPAMGVAADSPLLQVAYDTVDSRAQLVVTVPSPNALVWVDGILTQQQGSVRRLRTPELRTGREYFYNIVVEWTETCGPAHTVSRSVTLHAGEVVPVDLTR